MSLHGGDLLLAGGQHLIEGIPADGSFDAVHPLILLLGGGSRDPVEGVVPLHHSAVRLRFTGLDHLVLVLWDEELKAVRLLVLHLPDAEVLQWNDPSGLFVSGVLKVIQTVVRENEPSSLPGLDASP